MYNAIENCAVSISGIKHSNIKRILQKLIYNLRWEKEEGEKKVHLFFIRYSRTFNSGQISSYVCFLVI